MAAISAICVAVTNNYILNHRWTFGVENEDNCVNFRQYGRYVLDNMFGATINLIVLNVIIWFFSKDYYLIGRGVGILCGMSFNYFAAKKLVFIKRI
jgi:putative flippase GtrA